MFAIYEGLQTKMQTKAITACREYLNVLLKLIEAIERN
jgi:hypothetical protein